MQHPLQAGEDICNVIPLKKATSAMKHDREVFVRSRLSYGLVTEKQWISLWTSEYISRTGVYALCVRSCRGQAACVHHDRGFCGTLKPWLLHTAEGAEAGHQRPDRAERGRDLSGRGHGGRGDGAGDNAPGRHQDPPHDPGGLGQIQGRH